MLNQSFHVKEDPTVENASWLC